jgi:hypothetical protein
MAGTQDTPSSNLRYYAHVHEEVLCNAECAANIVVYFYVLFICTMYDSYSAYL